jgi:hypothetical protein
MRDHSATARDIKTANRIYRRKRMAFWAVIGIAFLWIGTLAWMLLSLT